MDIEQISKKLEWLDTKRKEENEEVQRLKTQISDLERSINSLTNSMDELTGEVSRLAAQTTRVNQFDEALAKFRIEVSKQLEEAETRRTKKENQIESLRRSDQKNLVNSIDEVKQTLERLDSIDEQLNQRKAEDNRLNRDLGELEEDFKELQSLSESQKLQLVSLEEEQVQLSKKFTAVQSDTNTINRKIQDQQNTLERIEDQNHKFEVSVSSLKASDKERDDQMEVWMDDQRMRLVDFEKQVSAWQKRFDDFSEEAKQISEKVQAYDQTYRTIKQMQDQLDGLLDRLERRITEVGEMQRLSEERLKQDWATFEADESQKWTTFKLSSEERWKEHERLHGKLSTKLAELTELSADVRGDLNTIIEREARRTNELLALSRQWAKEQDQ